MAVSVVRTARSRFMVLVLRDGTPIARTGADHIRFPARRYHPVMRLIPWEEERLAIFAAAELARRHRAAGLRLNHPEAVAVICDAMLEAARAGATYGASRPPAAPPWTRRM